MDWHPSKRYSKREQIASKKQVTRIFVVDDEPVIASTLATILQQNGFSATSFTNPLDALERARTDAPDLLISDVMMPQLSGIDLAIRMKKECLDVRYCSFPARLEPQDLLHSACKQGHDFHLLSKPVHPTDLLQGIRVLAK